MVLRVTDENGVSAGPGIRGINLLGHEAQPSVAVRFGGETGVTAAVDATTITPGTWMRHLGFSYSQRRNTLYDFDERATSADAAHRSQPDAGSEDRRRRRAPGGRHGIVRCVALCGWHGHDPHARRVRHARHAGFVHESAPWHIGRSRGGTLFGEARSWTVILDGRRFQRLAERHGLGLFALAPFQTGEVGTSCRSICSSRWAAPTACAAGASDRGAARNQFIGTLEYTYVVQPVRAFSVTGLNLYGGLQLVGFARPRRGV